jgi:hypothetical protein
MVGTANFKTSWMLRVLQHYNYRLYINQSILFVESGNQGLACSGPQWMHATYPALHFWGTP